MVMKHGVERCSLPRTIFRGEGSMYACWCGQLWRLSVWSSGMLDVTKSWEKVRDVRNVDEGEIPQKP